MAPLLVPAVSLIAEFVPDLLRLFKNDKAADVAEKVATIAKKVSGTEDLSESEQMIKADPALAIQFKQAVMDNALELEKLAFEKEKLYVGDTQDARKYRDDKTFWLGVSVMAIFLVVIILVLCGAYFVVVGTVTVEPGIFAAVSGFVGTLVGYVAAQAQSIINFYFGSSSGSMQKSDQLADSIKNFKRG